MKTRVRAILEVGSALCLSKLRTLYAFFWVIPRRLNFICRRFGTLCLFHLHRQVGACRMNWLGTCLGYYRGKGFGLEMAWVMQMEECSETSAYKIRPPGNHRKEGIQRSGHGESLKSRIFRTLLGCVFNLTLWNKHVKRETKQKDAASPPPSCPRSIWNLQQYHSTQLF